LKQNALRIVVGAAIAAATFVAVACSVSVDLAGKQCPCGPDYVCDTSTNTCVTPDQLTNTGDSSTDGPFIDPDSGLPVCPDDKCPCSKDGDRRDPARARCGPNKLCVECQREPNDTCPAGSFCNAENQCTLGCKQETDCQLAVAPHCNAMNHQCVECVTASQCGDAGLLCSPSGSCVEGCDLDAGVGCSGTKTCCGNFCLNLQNDVLNCGACGNACSKNNVTPTCNGGNCNFQSCASGYANCNGGTNDGCETNVRLPQNCGSCGHDCTATVQNADNVGCNPSNGQCTFSCKLGFGNCNGGSNDGCECSCGSFVGQICCPANPGPQCTFVGGKCVNSNPPKCQ